MRTFLLGIVAGLVLNQIVQYWNRRMQRMLLRAVVRRIKSEAKL